VVRLEAASGRRSRVGLDPTGRRADPANTAGNTVARQLLAPLPAEVRYILGDTHYNDPEIRTLCEQTNRALVATQRGAYPHHDAGVEVRRIFHQLRSQAIAPFNGLFKYMFE
jgi:hypothetical protein